jgi:hypothetical protein
MKTKYFIYFLSGLIFSIGLGVSGMMNPNNVKAFLLLKDFKLAFVMVGGIATTFLTFPLIFKREKPLMEDKFNLPTKKELDSQLIIGSAIFGIGWGISGFCPGPALANLSTGNPLTIIFVLSMFLGFWLQRVLPKLNTSSNIKKMEKRTNN